MAIREYHRTADWAAALALLHDPARRAVPLVFGPRLPDNPFDQIEVAVDLSPLGLDYVRQGDDGSREVGSLARLQDLVESELVRNCAGGLLAEAARHSAHPGLRQVATVAGAVLTPHGPPEVLLALLALDARVVQRGAAGERELPLAEFLALGAPPQGEWLAAVRWQCPGGQAGGALTRTARTPRDAAIVAAAAVVTRVEAVCQSARLAVAGAGVIPHRATLAEAGLQGRALTVEAAHAAAAQVVARLEFASDLRASAEYRRATAEVLARRALLAAWAQTGA